METMQNAHDRLDVRHLRLVRAIGEQGSVTKAAGKLHLSQSAVSHQLLDLERDLETRLFDRVGKKMVPTAAGARLIAGAERLLGDLAELERELAAARADTRIPLRVTTSCFTSYSWLPKALTRFGVRHPNVDLDIVIEATRRAVPALIADEIDLAIVTDPPRDETWQRVAVADSELIAVARPDHPIVERKRRGALPWGALRDCEILVYDISDHDMSRLDTAVRESWRRDSGQRLAAPITVRKIPLAEALLELARAGRGVGIVDRWTIEAQLDRRLVALPMAPRAPRTFYAVWRRSNPRNLPMRELVETIEQTGSRAVRAGA